MVQSLPSALYRCYAFMAQAGTRPEYVVVLPAANKRGLSARRCAVIRGVRWGGLPMIREKIEETHHSYCNTVIAALYDVVVRPADLPLQ